jgi:glycosyltransferase involved in cell wall biosynthesis
MRVLFIANTFPPGYTGGAEVANYHTCRGLIRRGVSCSMLVLNNRITTPLDEFYELDTIPVHRIYVPPPKKRTPWTDLFDRRIYLAALKELRRLKPDIVHIHNVSGATLAPYVACRTLAIPVVNTLHDLWLLCPNNMRYRKDNTFCNPKYDPDGCQLCFNSYDYWAATPYRRQLFAKLTANVRFFISPSQAVIERHVEAGYERERFRLVRLGFEVQPPAIAEHPGVQHIIATRERYRTLVFAGGGIEIKGVKVVWEALPILLRHVENFRLVVAGTGEAHLFELFRPYESRVHLLGRVPFKEIRALFAAADLTVIASVWHENSPVVIFENFQVGTPVVGSNFGGIPEFIQHKETGYLFPLGDGARLAECVVEHFARRADERRRMRQRCLQQVHTNLSLAQHLDSLINVYHEVLGG